MKLFKRILLVLAAFIVIAAIYNYPKLNIISGFASKNLASTHYIADRLYADIVESDNNVPLIKLAELERANENNVVTSLFGLMERESICRDGLGCVLINEEHELAPALKPNRSKVFTHASFPFGNDGIVRIPFDNVDYDLLEKAVDGAFSNPEVQKTRTVLVAYKNRLLTERYAEGFDPNTPILGWSMAKSVLATIYGVLEHQGKIDMDYRPFKELELTETIGEDPRDVITLDDLLRMSSGLDWDDDYTAISDATKMLFLDADMTQAQLNTDFDLNNHRKVWNYSSGTSNLLSGILRKKFKTYQEYLDFPL